MLKIKNEITKRVFFSIALVVIFIPLFIITKYAGMTGRIISASFYILIGMYVIYEILVSLQINSKISIISSFVIPLFFVFPIENFISIIKLNKEGTNFLHILSKRAINSWEGWIFILIFSFLPLLLQSRKKLNITYFMHQAIITSIFIIIPVFNKLFWVYNIKGIEIIVFFILISTISDTSAYFGGKFFGKKIFNGKKIAPRISPKKTYAGLFIGIFFSTIFAILYGYFFHIWKDFQENELLFSIIFGILLSLISPIGDLFFSAIKRIIGIKDFSNVIPGHGGFMDRLDSMSFVFSMSGLFMLFVFF